MDSEIAEFEWNKSWMLFWVPQKVQALSSKSYTRAEEARCMVNFTSCNKVCVCLKMLHLFDIVDRNMTLVSKRCMIMKFRCSLLAKSRQHWLGNTRPKRLWMQFKMTMMFYAARGTVSALSFWQTHALLRRHISIEPLKKGCIISCVIVTSHQLWQCVGSNNCTPELKCTCWVRFWKIQKGTSADSATAVDCFAFSLSDLKATIDAPQREPTLHTVFRESAQGLDRWF